MCVCADITVQTVCVCVCVYVTIIHIYSICFMYGRLGPRFFMLSVCDCAGLTTSSSIISPILAPVSNKLKSSVSAVSRPPEGENKLHSPPRGTLPPLYIIYVQHATENKPTNHENTTVHNFCLRSLDTITEAKMIHP